MTIASLLATRADALTIVPEWDSSITSDPNAAQIESLINGVISNYETAFSGTNITVDVNIEENSSVGGAENIPNTYLSTYTAYRAALQTRATTLDSVAVNAGLTLTNPLNSSTYVEMSRANAAALGFSVPTNSDGSVTTGTIILGLTSGATVNTSFILQAFAHEFDEELGTVSGVGGSYPWSIDFTRYSAAGARSFTTNTATHAYFSIDGVNMLAEYNQYNHVPGDWGDFALGPVAHVQDYAISGATVPAIEFRMLNSVGYVYSGRSISNAFATNTLNTVTLSTASTAAGVIPNVPSNDVHITEGGGTGVVTLAAATTAVNSLTNTATATAVTVNLAGQQLVAGNGAIDAGTGLISVGAGATSMTVGASANDGTVTAGSSGAFTLGLINAGGNASLLDIRSAIVNNAGSGALSIITLNTGTVILEGTNTYTGATTIGSGSTLQVGNAGATGTLGSGAVEVDGTLQFNRSTSVTIANSFTGAGPIVQAGAGTAILTGGNSGYSGYFTINSGSTLQVGAGATSGDLGAVAVIDNGSLVFNRSSTFALSNMISGSGSLNQAGSGTLSFSGSLSYTGNTTIQSGILQIAGSGAIGNAADNYAGLISIANGALVEYSTKTNGSFSGVISGMGGLTKDTAGSELILTAANTYSGATTVNAGILFLNYSAAGTAITNIISSSSQLVMGDAEVLLFGGSGNTNSQTFAGTTFTGTQGNLTMEQYTGTLHINLGPITFNPGSSASFVAMDGTYFVTSTGSANALLGHASMYNGTDWAAKDSTNTDIVAYTGYTNIYTGNTGSKSVVIPNSASADVRIEDNGSAGSPNTLASSTTTIDSLLMGVGSTPSTVSMSGGTLVINGGSSVTAGLAVASGAQALTIGASANDGFLTAGVSGASTLLLISNNSSTTQGITINSAIKDNAGGGAVTLGASGGLNGGVVVLNGTNTFSGNIEITSAGTLQIGGAGSLGSGSYAGAILDDNLLRYSSSVSQTISGAISGTGSLTKDTSANTLILAGSNTYLGNTTISAGTLEIGVTGTLGGGAYAGLISGAGNLNYDSTATQILSGSNTSFTGNVAVNAGILKLGNSNALGAVNTAVSKVTVASGATLDVSGNTGDYGVTIAGSGSAGQGALINSGASTGTSAQTPNITLSANATIGGSGDFYEIAQSSGADTLTLAGFTLTKIGSNNIWLANTTVTSGTIEVSGGALAQYTASNAAAAAIILDNTAGVGLSLNNIALSVGSLTGGGTTGGNVSLGSGTLTVGALGSTTTYAGVISGTGGLTLTGSGLLAITGANTYTGAATISSGTLSFASGSLASSSAILMNGGTLQWNGSNTQDVSSQITMVNSAVATFDTVGNNVSLASAIGSGSSGSLVKVGAGTLVLGVAATYTGATTVSAGTLQLGSSSASGGLASSSVAVNAAGTLAFGEAGTVTLTTPISGSGKIAQTGSGTTTLAGTNSFAGTVAVNAGTLLVSGSVGDVTATIGSGGAFGGSGTVGSAATKNASLTLQAGSILVYPGGALTLNGSLSITGVAYIGFSSSPVNGTAYSLVDYTGTLTGASNLTSNYRGTIDTSTLGVLKFDAAPISLTWRGTANANWGVVDGNNNFVHSAAPTTADNFYQGDTVTFDDTSTVKSVTLNGALMPAAITVNSTGTYTFGGTGSIGGAASITQSGTGTLILNTANTYTGATNVNAGILQLGNSAALGSTSGVALTTGAALDLNALTIPTMTLSGAGSIGNSSTTTEAAVTNLTLSANATISNTSSQSGLLLGSLTGQNGGIALQGYTLTKNGTGTVVLNGVDMTGAGNIVVNAGALQIVSSYGTNGSTQQATTLAGIGTLTVNSGGSVLIGTWVAPISITMPIVLNGGTLGSIYPSPNGATIASNISLTANSIFNFAGGYGTVTLSGAISGSGYGLTVMGDSNTRTLTGANSYTGNTTLSNGTLVIGGASVLGSGSYSGAISLASGTTFVYSSSASQTLSGAITGAGALTQSAGTLALTNASDSYSGATTVMGGVLQVNGSIANSAATVDSGATIVGAGIFGAVTIQSGGDVQPGTTSGAGLMNTKNFSLASGAKLALELGGTTGTGTSGTQYGELDANGTVTLGGSAQVSLFNGYSPRIGDTFYVILTTASNMITGTFSDAPGGVLFSDGIYFGVNYTATGGGGPSNNAVSLTVLAVPEPGVGVIGLCGLGLATFFRPTRKRRR